MSKQPVSNQPMGLRAARRRARGFTLIELMVVIAVIGILAAIAIPAYQDSVRKSRRSIAQGCLTEHAQFMERFYTTHLQYHQTRASPPVAVPDPTSCSQDITAFYDFAFDPAPTATTFVLSAAPKDAQADDECGTMTLSNTGAKTALRTDCWR
jgi:type IV pilus assembly protein PilE